MMEELGEESAAGGEGAGEAQRCRFRCRRVKIRLSGMELVCKIIHLSLPSRVPRVWVSGYLLLGVNLSFTRLRPLRAPDEKAVM